MNGLSLICFVVIFGAVAWLWFEVRAVRANQHFSNSESLKSHVERLESELGLDGLKANVVRLHCDDDGREDVLVDLNLRPDSGVVISVRSSNLDAGVEPFANVHLHNVAASVCRSEVR